MKHVASTLDLPVETVAHANRRLTQAGLLTRGGRGSSAAQRTELDAARLLIALMGSHVTSKAAETVRTFGQLVSLDYGRTPLVRLGRLHSRNTLETALAGLLAAYQRRDAGDELAGLPVKVRLRERQHDAEIIVGTTNTTFHEKDLLAAVYGTGPARDRAEARLARADETDPLPKRGLRRETWIGADELRAIALFISERPR